MRSGVLKMRSCVLEKKKDAELCAEKCNATPECVGISIAVLLGHCWLKVAPFYYYCPRCPSCWATAGSRLPLFIIIVPVALFIGPLLAQGCRFLLLLSPLPFLLGHCWLKVAPFYYYCPRAVAQGCRFLLLLSPLPCLLLLLSPLKLPCLLDFHPRVPEQLLAQGCPFFSCFFSPVFFLCALASFARACLLSKET